MYEFTVSVGMYVCMNLFMYDVCHHIRIPCIIIFIINPLTETLVGVHNRMLQPPSFSNVVVHLEHSHRFIDSLDNQSTASGPAWCRRRRPPGNAVSGQSSTMCLVVWWLSLCRGKQVMRSRPIGGEIRRIWPGHISDDSV